MRDAGDAELPAVDRALSISSMGSTGPMRARRRWVLVPAVALVLVLGLGLWAYSSVERSQKAQRRDELQALLRASVEGVTTWFSSQELLTDAVASDPGVIDAVRTVIEARAAGTPGDAAHAALDDELSLLLASSQYEQFSVTGPDGIVVASSAAAAIGRPIEALVAERAASGHSTRVWPPYATRADTVRMAVSAPIRDRGIQIASMFLEFDPAGELTRILSAARSGTSGETYAFNQTGRLVSQSRFEDTLRAIGLIDPGAPSSVLNLELRDPGVDLTRPGAVAARRDAWPHTLAVTRAIADRGAGFDVDGYRDYRGVPVIGAWMWLPKYDFGIVTEKDTAEAFALRDTIRRAIAFLFVALVIVLLALLAVAYFASLLQRRTRKAEARVQQLGQYRLIRKLGEGGVGSVYVGQHTMLRRPTAIKLLRPEGADRQQAIARFEREVRITSQLTHPNTIAVYDYGVTPEGTFYYAMELLDGIDLDALVERVGPLPPGRVIHILLQACGSLAEAHAAGLIHRDVKPANMIVCTRGSIKDTLKVLDFGLVKQQGATSAKLTAVNSLTGTPAFVAPEVIADPERASPATDIYSLGATAYYLITGHLVFERRETFQTLAAHLSEAPAPPSVHVTTTPRDLEVVILRCLEKDPVRRFADMDGLACALRGCASCGAWTQDDARTFWTAYEAMPPPPEKAAPPITADTVDINLEDLTRGVA